MTLPPDSLSPPPSGRSPFLPLAGGPLGRAAGERPERRAV